MEDFLFYTPSTPGNSSLASYSSSKSLALKTPIPLRISIDCLWWSMDICTFWNHTIILPAPTPLGIPALPPFSHLPWTFTPVTPRFLPPSLIPLQLKRPHTNSRCTGWSARYSSDHSRMRLR